MISASFIKNKYNDLYSQLQKYIWNFDQVEKIADLETECYTAFPSMESLQRKLKALKQSVIDTLKDDEELAEAFKDLEVLLYKEDGTLEEVYVNLPEVQEVI